MYLKKGVKLRGVQPEILFGLLCADSLHRQYYGGDITVTSCMDGTHKVGSKHYKGMAVDLRRWSMDDSPDFNAKAFAYELALRLGDEFDVVLERTHIHLEFDDD